MEEWLLDACGRLDGRLWGTLDSEGNETWVPAVPGSTRLLKEVGREEVDVRAGGGIRFVAEILDGIGRGFRCTEGGDGRAG